MYQLQFGSHVSGKWKPTLSLSYDTVSDGRDAVLAVSEELVQDSTYHLEVNTQAKLVDADDKVLHYITAAYPGVWLPPRI